jgi:hypothetical protein
MEQRKQVLAGLKEIAAYLRISIRAARREIQDHGLPVRMVAGSYTTTVPLLESWISDGVNANDL